MHGFLIAAPQSGSGKTTVSLAIMAALCRRGLKVAPFKCGPDFIDPGYHSIVTGRPSINLDGWMCPAEFVRQTFRRHGEDADVAVIEGVMGLFDGIGASSGTGSSAQIAAMTGAPVVLVVNARGMAASAAALVGGFAGFDPQIRLGGVIFNNVGSDSHGQLLRAALAEALPEISVFGCIPRDESLAIPSRHLGLVTVEDNPLPDEFVRKLADMAERCLDLDRLAVWKQIPPSPPLSKGRDVFPHSPSGRGQGGVRLSASPWPAMPPSVLSIRIICGCLRKPEQSWLRSLHWVTRRFRSIYREFICRVVIPSCMRRCWRQIAACCLPYAWRSLQICRSMPSAAVLFI